MDYKEGDILQLNEEGLRQWTGGIEKDMTRCRTWRFRYLGLDPLAADYWKEPCLHVRRIDIATGKSMSWSRRFLEKAV